MGVEEYRSKVLASVAQSYGQMMSFQKAFNLLPCISGDWDFLEICETILNSEETLSKEKVSTFLKDALYQVLPLSSQRRRQIYLKVVQQALPHVVKHLPAEQARSILAFLEEQWDVPSKVF
jgi:hypothetical protein